jgi:hypothetical protein
MATFKGHGFLYGVSPSGLSVAIGGYTKAWIDSLPIAHRCKMDEHVGTNGLTGAFVFLNEYFELQVSFRPSSTSTVAAAGTETIFVPKGSVLALSGFQIIRHNSVDILNGNWLYVGDSTITLNKDEPATIDMSIRRYVDSGQMNTLSTTVPAEEA